MTTAELRVAVVGVGVMGSSHVDSLSRRVRGARVTVVSDPDAGRAAAVAEPVGARVEPDPFAAIAAGDVDAVVLAGPGVAHEAQLLACLDAGRPVLCEKPMTPDEPGARAVVDAEAALGRRLVQVGFMRRFDDETRRLRALLAAGELGRPLLAHCVHRNASAPDWWETASALTESVSHEADQVRFLFGEEIVAVTVLRGAATGSAPAGVHDPLLVLFETESGVLVDVESFVRTGVAYEVRCEVVGEHGSVTIGLDRGPLLRSAGRWGGAMPPDFVVRFAAAYDAELQAFVDAAARGTVAGPGTRDGQAAVAVCAAATRALESGRRTAVPRPGRAGATAGPGPGA